MNRLILIGNGFDLAHGLQTSYNNFILNYISDSFCKAFRDYLYEDDLITIKKDRHAPHNFNSESEASVRKSIIQCYKDDRFNELISNSWFLPPDSAINMPNSLYLTIHSDFLKDLLSKCSSVNWVDIEGEFYDQLKMILKDNKHSKLQSVRLINLNHSMTALIDLLEGYLNKLPKPPYVKEYMDILTSPVRRNDVYNSVLQDDSEPANTHVLNFNYTTTLSEYLKQFSFNSQRDRPDVNFIHGRLNDGSNKLIFGFGDELDEYYLLMEKEKVKGYFDYIKSFWYFRTSNYRNLVTFIDSDEYQVYVLGHSCGLSDRTMLNMVFEHLNCKSIKIYYHGNAEKNNYVSLTHEIARHFRDKIEMRKKIVSLDRSHPMPQA
jgi:hypothetical protein